MHDQHSSLPRPPKELKGFKKIYLEPGESKTVELVLNREAFAFYDPEEKTWMAEKGKYDILIGSSVQDIRLQQVFTLEKSIQK